MANYKIEISQTAERQLKKVPRDDQKRIVRAILKLGKDPWPKGCRKLAGYEDVFRVRIGRYRVIYSVSAKRLIIIVLKIGHRKDVYR